MTREEKLEAQVKLLGDRLALALSFIADVELDVEFEKEAGEVNRFSEAKHMLLSAYTLFDDQRERWRGTSFFRTSTEEIKKWLTDELRKCGRARKAA